VAGRATAEKVVKRLRDAGYDAYFAGGCVRDLVMGREPLDYDIATSARPELVMQLFPGSLAIGAVFGVVVVRVENAEHEVATFRTDGPTLDERRPIAVHYCTAQEDVKRRDFTINGMLYDPIADEVLDWVGGRQDIERRLIRAIGDPEKRFAEDRLRLLRAVRFAARFAFDIEPDTWRAVRDAASCIVNISAERIRDELVKMFTLPEGRGGRALQLLLDAGLLERVLPEVSRYKGVQQPPQFHPEGDVFEHTRIMLELARNPSPELAMACVLHDVGKPDTQTFDERIRFNEHDRVGAEIGRAICQRLRFSNDQVEHIEALVGQHMRVSAAPDMRPGRLKQLLALPKFEEHLELHRLDCLASHRKLAAYEFLAAKRKELSQEEINPRPLITGADLISLGLTPGPIFGQILAEVREKQLDGELTTREGAMEYVRGRHVRARMQTDS
jgi:putative nucleotidyltransferase with HDIG domain